MPEPPLPAGHIAVGEDALDRTLLILVSLELLSCHPAKGSGPSVTVRLPPLRREPSPGFSFGPEASPIRIADEQHSH
jgi:hypothetical protein